MLKKVASYVAHLPGLDRARAAFRERQQHEVFAQQVRLAGAPEVRSFSLEAELAKLRPNRRKLSDRPRVVALGHEDWERFGLWPSFARVADFHHLSVPTHRGEPWTELDRAQLKERLLALIDDLERKGPVELAYMYCDSSYLSPALLRELSKRGIWTVLMGLDDQHKFLRREEWGLTVGQVEVAPLVDVYWTTWKLGADLHAAHGGRPWCAPEGADPVFHHPTGDHRDLDAVFVGANYGVRGRLVRFLRSAGLRVSSFGRGWPAGFLSFEETVRTFNRAKVVLGVGNVGEMGGVFHMKGRDFEVPMCGAVYLTSFNPDLADSFEVGREILCYSSLQNCAEVLRWILSHPDKQEEIRVRALRRSLCDHTWERRLTDLFHLIESDFPGTGATK